MTISYLQEILDNQNVDFEIIYHAKAIKSRNDGLELFDLESMAPTLILKSEDKFFALIASGKRENINFYEIAKKLDLTELRMAKRSEVKKETNLKPGQIPLVGHQLPCIIDKEIYNQEYVFGGSGDLNHTLKIKPNSLREINNVILEF